MYTHNLHINMSGCKYECTIDVNIQQQLGSVAKLNLFISSYAVDCETPLKGF